MEGSSWRRLPRGGIARVREQLTALALLLRVQGQKIIVRQVDLAADFHEMSGNLCPVRDVRHVADGPDVGGHILALGAVAARGRGRQPPALVAQRAGQAVDLGLAADRDRRLRVRSSRRKLRSPSTQSRMSSSAKALLSDSIGTAWRTLRKPAAGGAPTRAEGPPTGSVRSGNRRSSAVVPAPQGIVLPVADFRRVLLVVLPVVMRNPARQGLSVPRCACSAASGSPRRTIGPSGAGAGHAGY